MADIVTLGVGGLIIGSIYLINKALNNHTTVITTSTTKIIKIRDDIKRRRQSARVLKRQLQMAHDAAFEAWAEIKKISDGLYRTLKQAQRRLANTRLSRQERQNLNRSRKTLAKELEKAVQVKRKAHKRWQKLRTDYLAARGALNLLR